MRSTWCVALACGGAARRRRRLGRDPRRYEWIDGAKVAVFDPPAVSAGLASQLGLVAGPDGVEIGPDALWAVTTGDRFVTETRNSNGAWRLIHHAPPDEDDSIVRVVRSVR
jgi:hypothetical protein